MVVTCVLMCMSFQVQVTDCEGLGSQFAWGLSCLPQLTINRDSGLDVSSPKHGKVPCLQYWQHPCEHLALSGLMQICCMLLFVTVHVGLSREYCLSRNYKPETCLPFI